MDRLEKVIKGLECCIKRNPDDKTKCDECPYEGACLNRLKADSLVLLKAQEPIQIIKVGYYDHGKCPKCDRYVSRYSNFCWYCGQAVKWE